MDWKDWRCGGLHWMEAMTMKVIDRLGEWQKWRIRITLASEEMRHEMADSRGRIS
jgi:hypothetical protein